MPTTLAEAEVQCAKCHGYYPTDHEADANCSRCHGMVVNEDDFTFKNKSLHIDGETTGGGCTTCHGEPPTDSSNVVNSPEYTQRTAGAHAKHMSPGSIVDDCDYCHMGGGDANHTDRLQITIGFSNAADELNTLYKGGDYYWATPVVGNYTIRTVDGVTTAAASAGNNRTCANIYCHSDGGDFSGTLTNAPASVTDFDVTFDYGADGCSKCHNDGGTGWVDNNVHPQHVDAPYSMGCVVCHAGTVDINNTIVGIANHVNAVKDVVFSGVAVGADAYTSTRPACTNLYCHSQGKSSFSSPETTANWDYSGGGFSCVDCHRGTVASGAPMLSDEHTSHINNKTSIGRNFACMDCHIGTLDADETVGATKIGNHIDGAQTVLMNSVYGGSMNGSKVCSSVYCHSDGNVDGTVGYKDVTWVTDSTDCKSCHGDGSTVSYPTHPNGAGGDSNAHAKHVTDNSIGCQYCHVETTADGTTINGSAIANHINLVTEVDMKYAGTYTEAGESCGTDYCHGNFAGGTQKAPAWGDAAGSQACPSCHNTYSPTPHAKDAHVKHIGTGTGELGLACTACHGTGWVAAGHIDADVVWGLQTYPSAEYSGSNTGNGGLPSTTVGQCTNLYCHSNAQSGAAGDQPPTYIATDWDNNPAVGCDSCHASPMTAGSHPGHIALYVCDDCHDGAGDDTLLHANKIIEVSFLAANAGGSATYDDPDTNNPEDGYNTCSTSFCHGDLSPAWGANLPGKNICVKCHGDVSKTEAGAVLADSAPGANGVGNDLAGESSPSISFSNKVGAHRVHLEATDAISDPIACSECHPVPTFDTGVKESGHIDDDVPAEVPVDGTLAQKGGLEATYTPGNPGTCSNVWCHTRASRAGQSYNDTPEWTDVAYFTKPTTFAEAQVECSKCHGFPPASHVVPDDNTCWDCHPWTVDTDHFTIIINADTKHVNAAIEGAGDCVKCHSTVKTNASFYDEFDNGVRNVVAEFGKNSHHAFEVPLTPLICSTCHGEGDSTGNTTGLHNNHQIDLRDTDNDGTYFAFNGTQHANVDKHCMSCHDDDGATATNWAHPGVLNGVKPWGDVPVTNRYDRVDRGTVWDVVKQFYPGTNGPGASYNGNPSQHAVLGKRFSGTLLRDFVYTATSENLLLGVSVNGTAMADNLTLHCGDCHTLGKVQDPDASLPSITGDEYRTGAHGSKNEYMLRTWDLGLETDPQGDDVLHKQETWVVCYNCHAPGVYQGKIHGPDNNGDKAQGPSIAYPDTDWETLVGLSNRLVSDGVANGMNCSGCHNSGATDWAGTHGSNVATYTDHYGNTQGTYRFMPGMSNDGYSPAGADTGGGANATPAAPT
jgi:predicted CxxxxCH...CXXCH cytochrome family protein